MPTLYLIPTPLAPDTASQVLTPPIPEVITRLDCFFVEELRTARRFISSLRTGRIIDETTFFELHKDTPEADTKRQLTDLLALNRDAGILSEAGCPGVADPGAVAVRLAHQLGFWVEPLVGPSSILLALMASGMSGQSFVFHGYLPIDRGERSRTLKQLETDARKKQQTQIFMETPYRNNALLADLLATCLPDTRLCIAANVTAPDALIQTKPIKQWKMTIPDLHKKPTIFLLF
ncbi:SAM-dependent methyltransferase [Fibrella forsythiae]|uniref:SAM-dependent methyltransferase n=1 Tax=Fibrella forsythiae TaxID=2817061 RepID=A0ABS3JGG8_9BACT|nr:SAM-dependent methyltransferase [Fibrella forsythiae]MBO0949101.1 SAM-dependent methyltransferase [Fibrella forsythiae]